MVFLLVPLACFLISVGVIYIFRPGSRMNATHNGTLRDLRFLLSFLTKTNQDEAHLRISVSRRVTWMDVDIRDNRFSVTIPLQTSLQKFRQNSYVEICKELGLRAKVEEDDEGLPELCFQIEINEAILDNNISKVFGQIFEVEADKKLEFEVWGLSSGQEYLDDALSTGWATDNLVTENATAFQSTLVSSDYLLRYYQIASGIFLRPVILMGSYLTFGFGGFSAAVLVYALFVLITKWRFQVIKKWTNFLVLSSLLLFFTVFSLVTSNPSSFQLLPFTIGIWLIISGVVSAQRPDRKESRRIILWSGVVGGVVTIIANELLRANVSFDTWLWVYSFAGMELIAAVIAILIPIAFMEHVWGYLKTKNS